MARKPLRMDQISDAWKINTIGRMEMDRSLMGIIERATCEPVLVYDKQMAILDYMDGKGLPDYQQAEEQFSERIGQAWIGPLTPAWFTPCDDVYVRWTREAN